MICLSCEVEVPYRSSACPACGTLLEGRSHFHADHVTQVIDGVEAYLAGTLGREQAMARYETFCAIVEEFIERWDLDSLTIAEHLTVEALLLFKAAKIVEESLRVLDEAFDAYDQGFANESRQDLLRANGLLEAFFRRCCQGLAEGSHVLRGVL